jgi:putative redox protein
MTDQTQRKVSLERVDEGVFRARNVRGGELTFGSKVGDGFTPVELLLTAIMGCSAVDIDVLTGRRCTPESFSADITAEAARDASGNILRDIQVTFSVRFPEGSKGDAARKILPQAMRISHERTCTVSRTVRTAVPVTFHLDES